MAKEPARRYQSPAALGEDLQRYLDGDAVTAVPPTAAYRFGKFVRRNKLAVAAASAVLLSLLVALGVSLVQVQRANQHAAEAESARAETTFTIADLYTNNGVAAGRAGDARTAALWFATAATSSAGDPERVQGNLYRATTWREESPTVVRACDTGLDKIDHVSWHAGGQHLMVSRDSDRALIISLESESALGVPGLGESFKVARWSHDGNYLATVAGDALKVVEFPSGKEIASTAAGSVERLEWSPADDCLTAGGDSGVFLWSPFVSERIELDDGANFVGARFSPDGTRLLLHGRGATIRGLSDLKKDLIPQLIADAGRGAGFLGDGDAFYLVYGLDIKIYDSLSGDRLETHTTTLDDPSWGKPLGASADGRYLIASGHQPLDRQDANAKFIRYPALFPTFSWHPDGHRLVISDLENNTRIFDLGNGRVEHEIGPIRLSAGAVAYSPRGQHLATGHYGGIVRVWRTDPKPDGKKTLPIRSDLFAISQDRQKIVPAGSGNYSVAPLPATRMFDLKTAEPIGEEMRSGGAIMNAAISGDGQWCALAVGTAPAENGRQTMSGPGQVEFFNPVTGEPLCEPFACRSQPRGLAVHPDGNALGVFCADGSAFEIAVQGAGDALQIEARALFSGGQVNAGTDSVSNGRCRYSEDGRFLIFFGRMHFHIWDREKAVKIAHESRAGSVHEVDSKGGRLAVSLAFGDDGVGVFDLSQERWVGEPIRFTHPALLARFDATGDHVLTNTNKGAAQVFDWRSGQPVGPAFDQSGTLLVGDFIDGTPWVATGGYTARDIRIWDATTGFEVRKVVDTPSAVLSLEYIAECRCLVVAGHELTIFDLDLFLPAPILDPLSAQQLAEFDAGGRVRRGGGLDVINNDEWLPLWRAFRTAHPDFPGHAVPTEPLPDAPDHGAEAPGFWAQTKASQAEAATRRTKLRAALADAVLITPEAVSANTDGDTYPAGQLIDGSGLEKVGKASDVLDAIHSYAAHGGTWVTKSLSGDTIDGDYFTKQGIPAPTLTFTLAEPTDISGFAFWGYQFSSKNLAIGNEPSELRFTFFDAAGIALADPSTIKLDRPTRRAARVVSLPPTAGVASVKVEALDNFSAYSGGDRVGMGEVRFLSGYRINEPAPGVIAEPTNPVITPIAVTSSTAAGANPDSYPAACLIDSSGLSGNPDTPEAIAQITHEIATDINTWITEGNHPLYFEGEGALPAPVLTFTLPQPSTVTGFAYWAYRYAEDNPAETNQPREFRFTLLDRNGRPLADPVSRTVTKLHGASGRIIPLPETREVKAVKVELLENFDGDRVGLAEVRLIRSGDF